jgi:hypothetical protein
METHTRHKQACGIGDIFEVYARENNQNKREAFLFVIAPSSLLYLRYAVHHIFCVKIASSKRPNLFLGLDIDGLLLLSSLLVGLARCLHGNNVGKRR